MAKIPKNLSDSAMIGSYQEKITFENQFLEEDVTVRQPVKAVKKDSVGYASEFFTPELQEKVGKALLELKVKMYNEGIVDFDIKVTLQDKQVIMTAVPSKSEKKKGR